MRRKRTKSAPVRPDTQRQLTSTPVTDYLPRSTTARSSRCRRVPRRVRSAMSGSGVGAALEAFTDISLDRQGFFIWRLEGRRLVLTECNDHGFFQEGTSYIVLKVTPDKTASLHYWCGMGATECDCNFIHDLAHELDSSLLRASVFSREVQGHESLCFMRLFPEGIIYLEGGPHSTLSRVTNYTNRLYVVTGRTHVRAACRPRVSVLDPSVCVILDGCPRVYVWIGSKCGYVNRVKAIQVARRIRMWQRKGKAHVVVIDEKDVELNRTFQKKLEEEPELTTLNGVNGAVSETTELTDVQETTDNVQLHRVSGDRVLYDMPFAASKPLQYKYLVQTSCYLLDTGPHNPLYLWVGGRAPADDVSNAISRGKSFLEHRQYPRYLPVCRLLDGHEPPQFRQAFNDWRERPNKSQSQTRKYSAGNMGRALFSRSGRRAVPKLEETMSDCSLEENDIESELSIYVLREQLNWVERWDYGTFHNDKCYILQHETWRHESQQPQTTLYYWIGSKSTTEAQNQILELVLTMDEHNTAVTRVLDGKEPHHMLNLLGNTIVVFDKTHTDRFPNGQLFSLREYIKGNIRVTQESPQSTSLNSSAACVLISDQESYLWYGRESGGLEREYAKHMLGCLNPTKMYDYDIVTEGKESDSFWLLLGGRAPYETEYITKHLERRCPRLLLYVMDTSENKFEEIVEYEQEDLGEDDVFVLDSFDQSSPTWGQPENRHEFLEAVVMQIFVWYGSKIQDSNRIDFPAIVQEYLKVDQAGRRLEDTRLWYICQGHETQDFTRCFKSWEPDGFGGREAYELARKRVRQENARTDASSDFIDKHYTSKPKVPYKTLVKGEVPPEVSPVHKEDHLTDTEFQEVLKVSRFQFYQLPEWKQKQGLKMAHLSSSTKSSASASSDKSSVPSLNLPPQW